MQNDDILDICDAYESGYGKGLKKCEKPNPHSENSSEYEAYKIGYQRGKLKSERK